MNKLKYFIRRWLLKCVHRLDGAEAQHIAELRKSTLSEWLYNDSYQIFEAMTNLVVCEDGSWNYFPLPSGKKLHFDFVLPSLPLYIKILGAEYADWETAKYHVTREEWEANQADIKAIELGIPKLATAGTPRVPKVIIFEWNDPINFFELESRFTKLGIE